MKFLGVVCVICCSLGARSLDREAFTFTKYELTVRVEPEQQRLGVRGKITLRNDSDSPQRSLSLQVSSSLNWSSIKFEGKPIEFVSQTYTSDIDHTGGLSEAIVVFPQPVAPKQTIELDIGYEGVIPQDTTRLTRIGVPADTAKHTDWDQIGRSFTAVRGIGYVAWYPVATEAASLSDGDSVEETSGKWKKRQSGCTMSLLFESTSSAQIFFSGTPAMAEVGVEDGIKSIRAFSMIRPGVSVPTFLIANYADINKREVNLIVRYLPGQEQAANEYADVGAESDYAGLRVRKAPQLEVFGLPDQDAASFVTQGLLLTPFNFPLHNDALLNMIYAKGRILIPATEAWIQEGVARYSQVAFIESLQSRQAALDYMRARQIALVEAEKEIETANTSRLPDPGTARSLIHAGDGEYLQTKAMYVWWMLRDIVGETALKGALFNYKVTDDTSPGYMENLIESQTHRDLHWFFDDWVYHDRGLPDFRIASVYPSALASGGYMVTVTVENRGDAGAEVPVTLHMHTGEESQRLVVPGKSKASVRIQATSLPQEVTVNDGSVPESDVNNNEYKIESGNH
jgi:hypothetical protein